LDSPHLEIGSVIEAVSMRPNAERDHGTGNV
jgi:hypothetical protein